MPTKKLLAYERYVIPGSTTLERFRAAYRTDRAVLDRWAGLARLDRQLRSLGREASKTEKVEAVVEIVREACDKVGLDEETTEAMCQISFTLAEKRSRKRLP